MKLFALLLAGSYAQYDQTDDGTAPVGDTSYDQYGADYYGGYDAGYGDAYGDSYGSYDSYGPGADDNRKGGNRNKNKGNKARPNKSSTNNYQAPANNYQAPTNNYQAPADNYQAPVENYQAPAVTYQEPAASYQAPADNYQAPADSYQAPAYQGMTCWSCHASTYEECGKNGYEQRCNPGDVCFLEVRERRENRYFSQIAMGCLQEMACENNKMQNFNQPNPDHTQCKPEAEYVESVCRQCCAEPNCTKSPSWWKPTTRAEWDYSEAPAYQEPAYQAPADNYQPPAANYQPPASYQAPANNYQAPPAAQESTYTAPPAYKK